MIDLNLTAEQQNTVNNYTRLLGSDSYIQCKVVQEELKQEGKDKQYIFLVMMGLAQNLKIIRDMPDDKPQTHMMTERNIIEDYYVWAKYPKYLFTERAFDHLSSYFTAEHYYNEFEASISENGGGGFQELIDAIDHPDNRSRNSRDLSPFRDLLVISDTIHISHRLDLPYQGRGPVRVDKNPSNRDFLSIFELRQSIADKDIQRLVDAKYLEIELDHIGLFITDLKGLIDRYEILDPNYWEKYGDNIKQIPESGAIEFNNLDSDLDKIRFIIDSF